MTWARIPSARIRCWAIDLPGYLPCFVITNWLYMLMDNTRLQRAVLS
jgi:hypothetical protein